MAPPVRLVVVDDSAVFRSVAHELLTARDFEVVGEAFCPESAFAAVDRMAPEGALIEIRLGEHDGVELAARLARERPGLAIVLTTADLVELPARMLERSGARGFVAKDELARVDLKIFWPGDPLTRAGRVDPSAPAVLSRRRGSAPSARRARRR